MDETRALNRIIDANFNRLREGLRVVEDIARFILNDDSISLQIKNIRSNVTSVGKVYFDVLADRNVRGDIGRDHESEVEFKRESIFDIAQANIKRVEESLRVLEECYKIFDINISRKFKFMRYGFYDIDKLLLTRLMDKIKNK